MKEMMYSSSGQKGGRGLKLHPDIKYVNLYHWLLGDTIYQRKGVGWGIPSRKWPYGLNANQQSNIESVAPPPPVVT